jgi:pilus assembly protein Flp/PilA
MDLKSLLIKFHADEDGASATEYIILLILIACVIIAIVKIFGTTVYRKYQSAASKVQDDVVFK